MLLFWVIGITIVLAVSFFLALRSMKDFKDTHVSHIPYTLYLVRNPHQLSLETLAKIHQLILDLNGIISFERLIKGEDKVLVIYCPTSLKDQLPELALLELEDYLEPITVQTPLPNKTSLNQILGWTIASKNNTKKVLTIKTEFLNLLDLRDSQKFFLQIVCQPIINKKSDPESAKFGEYQTTMRVLVADPNPNDRVELAKKMDQALFDATGLIKQAREQPNQTIYEEYIKRVFVPKEVTKNYLCSQEIVGLIKWEKL